MFFRPLEDGDLPWVIDSWLTSFRKSPFAGNVSNHRYRGVYGDTIDDLFERGMKVLMVARENKPDQLFAFLAYEDSANGPVVHYMFTRPGSREMGIATALLEQVGADAARFTHTFRTPDLRTAFPNARWKPWLSRIKQLDPPRKKSSRSRSSRPLE